MDPEPSRLVARGRDDAARIFPAGPADDDRPPAKVRADALLAGGEVGIENEV
jgi:hypothetical protein